MAANTVGLNQTFPIKNADGTPFYNLVLHKSAYENIVMSLGDKITGDVYYKDNKLVVTMHEYIEFNDVHFVLVNPPTIVREGMVADNSELRGMTKYSFTFYHPMYLLGNFPFTDVAVSQDEKKYLSESKKFSWIGYPDDFIAKLNKNLDGTEWMVVKSERFPEGLDDKLSEVQQFDGATIADALKRGYEIWGVPYIVDKVVAGETGYSVGKRFKVIFGLPFSEIYEDASHEQLDEPYVFQMGQGVGLKNNSRTPRNNKIITRISGYGSEDNVPYGYPQIPWYGDSRWDYTAYQGSTINYDTEGKVTNTPAANAYPLYMGIVGGAYVKLIKHPFTRSHLMPSVYSSSVFNKVSPYNSDGTANTNYNPDTTLVDYYDAISDQEHQYPNPIVANAPSYDIHEFEDVKPELDSDREMGIIAAVPLNQDLTPASSWDDTMDDDGNYIQSYFKVTLPALGFDIYACAAITQEMQINMRSGACLGCTFEAQVDWDDYKKNFYTDDGTFAPSGSQRDYGKYPDSTSNAIDLVLKKETSTFGTLMPNIYQYPVSGDIFVIIGISLPLTYIGDAEERLDEEMKSYMLENNVHYYDYPLKFDEFFLRGHQNILTSLKPNSVVHFVFGNETLQLYVKQITIKYGESTLPQYDITLTDNIEVVLNQIGQVSDDVEKLSSLISILRQNYSRNVWMELSKKLSKTQDDTAQGFIRMLQGIQVGANYVPDILGEGGVFRKDSDGKIVLVTDKLYARVKAYFDSVEIKDYKHTSGNRIASKAGIKCTHVEWLDASGNVLEQTSANESRIVKFRCYFRAKDGTDSITNDFVASETGQQDLAFCDKTSMDAGINQRRYWRAVVGKNGTLGEDDEFGYIDLSKSDCEDGSDFPMAEDDIIQLGNKTDNDRQGAIIEYVGGTDAPSYQIYQGINTYSLANKNYISFGYSSQTGRAYMNVYGDFRFGNASDDGSYIKYNAGSGQLDIRARIDASSPVVQGGATYNDMQSFVEAHSSDWTQQQIDALIHGITDPIQAQVDGAIDTWYYSGVPTLNNAPANQWTTDTEKDKHIGDLYYDKATGHGYRFMYDDDNDVYVWTVLTDEDVTEALRIASEAYDTADGKRTIYSEWNAWMDGLTNKLQQGDLFIPESNYPTTGTPTYKAKKVYKCTADGTTSFQEINYTDDSAFNGYISALLNGTGSSGDAATAAAVQKAISDALGGGTVVDGGLLLTSLIAMRKYNASTQQYTTWAGISGLYKDSETGTGYKGHGIAAWYGGAMVDKEVSTTATDYAKSLFRFDGSGYLASGNITWDKNGIVTIANVYSDVNGMPVAWSGATLQYMTNLATLLPITVIGSTTYLDPQVGFKQLSVLGKTVATQEWVGQNYVSNTFFNAIFQLEDSNGNVITPNSATTAKDRLKILVGVYTDQYLSALGLNPEGGGGGGVGDVTWDLLASNADTRPIALSHLTGALADYVRSIATNGSGNAITAVTKSGDTLTFTKGSTFLTTHQTLYTLSIYGGTTKVLDFKPNANASIYIKTGGDITLTNDTTNKYITLSYSHPTNGANQTITAANGKVLSAITVNNLGHVTSVSSKTLAAADIPVLDWSKITSGKPTTLAGYGITDAKIASGVITLGSNTITPVTSVAMTMPQGFTVTGSPISKTGTLAVSYTNGYEGFTTDLKSKINALYSWFEVDANGNVRTKDWDDQGTTKHRGFYSYSFVSALGQSDSSGGGGGGATALADLTDVTLTSPTQNQILVFNGTHWVNQNKQSLYVLPAATSSVLGGIKIGYSASGKNYAVQLDANNNAFVNVPWTDTTYTLAGLMGSSAIGGATQPIYWNGSAFVNTTYTLGKSVPSNAVFTDTNTWRNILLAGTQKLGNGTDTKGLNFVGDGKTTISFLAAGTGSGTSGSSNYATIQISSTWRGIQDNLTSDSTTDSLSAKQGKTLYGYITTLQGYFTNGVANSALKLSDSTARTAWGQTFFNNGKPVSISNTYMSGVTKINDLLYFSNGNVGIGTGYRSDSLLFVNGDTYTDRLYLYRPTDNSDTNALYLEVSGTTSLNVKKNDYSIKLIPYSSVSPYAFIQADSPTFGAVTFADTNMDYEGGYQLSYMDFAHYSAEHLTRIYGKNVALYYKNGDNDTNKLVLTTTGSRHVAILNPSYETMSGGANSQKSDCLLTVNGDTYTEKLYLYKPNAVNDENAIFFTIDTVQATGSSGNTKKVLKLNGDFYATGAVSALGANSSGGGGGGGGGGATALYGLLDVLANSAGNAVDGASAGNVLTFDSTAGKWKGVAPNNGALYLQASGTTKATFTANQSGQSTFNIAEGSANGTISVGGTNVAVHGLGSRAYDSTSYLPLSGGTISSGSVYSLYINNSASDSLASGIRFQVGGTTYGALYINSSDSELYYNGYKVWNNNNDGAGSGLDADLLDGKHNGELTASFFKLVANGTNPLDANTLGYGAFRNYSNSGYWQNTPLGMTYGYILALTDSNNSSLMGQIAWDINHGTTATTKNLWWRAKDSSGWANANWRQVAFTDMNVASATKLETSRTIWGQSFDGTANVTGALSSVTNIDSLLYFDTTNSRIGVGTLSPDSKLHVSGTLKVSGATTLASTLSVASGITLTTTKKIYFGDTSHYIELDSNGYFHLSHGLYSDSFVSALGANASGGGGSATSLYELLDVTANSGGTAVEGSTSGNVLTYDSSTSKWKGKALKTLTISTYTGNSQGLPLTSDYNGKAARTISCASKQALMGASISGKTITITRADYTNPITLTTQDTWKAANTSQEGYVPKLDARNPATLSANDLVIAFNGTSETKPSWKVLPLSAFGNQVSDIRKKDVINYDVCPSIDAIANAPTIRFTWNDKRDEQQHVGSIAQYWQTVLPETVGDIRGELTMNYGTIALLASIATAKKVQDHERRIYELEKENEMLRYELEQLKKE